MDQERSGGISSTGIVLIVLACLGLGVIVCAGLIVVCLVAITALGTSAVQSAGALEFEAESAANLFIRDLNWNLTQDAWDKTSAGFQNRHRKIDDPDPSKFFVDFLKEHPGLNDPAAISAKSQYAYPLQSMVLVDVTPKSGKKITLQLKLKKEAGLWKIDGLAVLGEKIKRF